MLGAGWAPPSAPRGRLPSLTWSPLRFLLATAYRILLMLQISDFSQLEKTQGQARPTSVISLSQSHLCHITDPSHWGKNTPYLQPWDYAGSVPLEHRGSCRTILDFCLPQTPNWKQPRSLPALRFQKGQLINVHENMDDSQKPSV